MFSATMLVFVIGTGRRGHIPGLIKPLVYLSGLPVIVYLLVFIPWFLKGYSNALFKNRI